METKKKPTKIGQFETWNIEAQMIEVSSDRVKSFIALIMAFLLVVGQMAFEGNLDSWGLLGVAALFLIYSATPKALKDLAKVNSLIKK
jgi:hypothetical protein